jgi:hypothetical protein
VAACLGRRRSGVQISTPRPHRANSVLARFFLLMRSGNCALGFTGWYGAPKRGSEPRGRSTREPVSRQEPQTVPGLLRSVAVNVLPPQQRKGPKAPGLSILVAASKTWLKDPSPRSGYEFASVFAYLFHLCSAGCCGRALQAWTQSSKS